jgi:murein DD-endopeptidase MepM/ murein hydrolase activator NlpD
LTSGVAALRLALHRLAREDRAVAGSTPAAPEVLTADTDTLISYTVAPGDTLSSIAARHGMAAEALMAINGLTDPDSLQVGQVLHIQLAPDRDGPATPLVPDSELLRGPAYLGFDTREVLAGLGSPLLAYAETVDGQTMDGAAMVERISRQFSVGPRVLLAFLEARSGQVSGLAPRASLEGYPAGMEDAARAGLWRQLNWLADRLNGGYYDLRTRRNRVLTLGDGVRLGAPAGLNAGSFAVDRVLGLLSSEDDLPQAQADFSAAYARLFGDPWSGALPTLDLAGLRFPPLTLPWSAGETWWMTGGPHGGWADGSAWAALDFVPDGPILGCAMSPAWVTAPADGTVLAGETGQVFLDLDGDDHRETGAVVMFLHLAAEGRAAPGSRLRRGDRLGHPSCEGGLSTATHLHIARLYDGEWLAAGGEAPFVMGPWTAWGAPTVYDGGLQQADGTRREACECRLPETNAVR